MPDVADFGCRTRRVVDLGFESITVPEMEGVADEIERVAKRWAAIFSDVESCHLWRGAFTSWDYVRTAEWRRIGGAPQFTGDRPSSGFEAITLVHPKGRKRWNGGGKAGSYEFPIVANRLGARGARVHPTQKPVELMLALVEDFSDPGEIVGDWYCGSGTTGVAALRLGRRFIGIERDSAHAETARQRLHAEACGSTIQASRAGQTTLFGAAK
jgi:site-specific DNA-methyltransferase (adenine-specific)